MAPGPSSRWCLFQVTTAACLGRLVSYLFYPLRPMAKFDLAIFLLINFDSFQDSSRSTWDPWPYPWMEGGPCLGASAPKVLAPWTGRRLPAYQSIVITRWNHGDLTGGLAAFSMPRCPPRRRRSHGYGKTGQLKKEGATRSNVPGTVNQTGQADGSLSAGLWPK